MKKIKLIKNLLFAIIFIAFICSTSVKADVLQQYSQQDMQQQDAQQQMQQIQPIQSQSTVAKPSVSTIEKIFNDDTGIMLKQVGYDLFSNSIAQGFGKYDGSYKLNIGEKVNVYSWGDSVDMISLSGASLVSPLTNTQIDGKGNLFVPGIGMVKADGKTISDVEKEIQSLAGQKFTNVKVKITVADSNSFSIFVYGYVNKPGKVAVNSNSSVIEALVAAGGVSKNGSLRDISYKSGGKAQKVDLYKVMFQGKDSGIILRPNDTIFVNSIGSVVGVKNGVKIPGIYEVSSGDNLNSIINYAGGFLPSTDRSNLNIKAYNSKDGQRISMDIPTGLFGKTKLTNGDILEFHDLYGNAEDFITLKGNIKHPGVVAYKKGMRLSDVLKNKNELKDETFIHQAVITRTVGDDKRATTIPVSLEEFFDGGSNPILQPKDIITVYRGTNSEFIEVYGCIDKPKQIPYNEKLTLKDVMADIQFIKSSDSKSNIHNVSTISSDNVLIPAYDIAVEITNKNDATPSPKTFYLYDILVQNDAIGGVEIIPGDKIFFRPLRENEILKTVKVSGYVNKPGVYKFVEGKKLSDAIESAGGLTKDANLKGVVFKRKVIAKKEQEAIFEKNQKDLQQLEGQLLTGINSAKSSTENKAQSLDTLKESISVSQNKKDVGRIALDIKSNDLNKISDSQNIFIQDGDEIYIPKYSNHVMVVGEVYNETSFIYKSGEKASYYIKMVGGYTPNARRTKIYKIGVNGRAKKLNLLASNPIEPGDTIIVPRKLPINDWITPVTSAIQSIASILTSVFIVTKL